MEESVLDFLLIMLVLSVSTVLGFNITYKSLSHAKELAYINNYNKTVNELEGDRAELGYDGTMSSNEIVLTVMGQNYFMPSPGKVDIAGVDIQISNNKEYATNVSAIGLTAQKSIDEWFNGFKANKGRLSSYVNDIPDNLEDARFRLQFSMNNPDIKSDDTYSMFIQLKNKNNKKTLYKCVNGGRIELKEGVIYG